MATRRARLQVRPNVGSKVRSSGKLSVTLPTECKESNESKTETTEAKVLFKTDDNIIKEKEVNGIASRVTEEIIQCSEKNKDCSNEKTNSENLENIDNGISKSLKLIEKDFPHISSKVHSFRKLSVTVPTECKEPSGSKIKTTEAKVLFKTDDNVIKEKEINDAESSVTEEIIQCSERNKDCSSENLENTDDSGISNSFESIEKDSPIINKEETSEINQIYTEDKEFNLASKISPQKEPSKVLPLRSRFPKAKPNILSINRLRTTKSGPPGETEEKNVMGSISHTSSTPLAQDLTVNNVLNDKLPFKIPHKTIEKDETPSRRRRRYIKGNKPPERSKMTMRDLIYWNPTTNPMKLLSDEIGKEEEQILNAAPSVEEEEETVDDPLNDSESENSVHVPQVRVTEDGRIVINEESLVIDTTPKRPATNNNPIVYEKSSSTTYTSFCKRTSTKIWTEKETSRFYRALRTVGTDFSLMNTMFPKRSRAELKNKFKKEERINKVLVDEAIRDRQHFNISIFEASSESETDAGKTSIKKVRKVKRNKKNNKEIKENTLPKENLIESVDPIVTKPSENASNLQKDVAVLEEPRPKIPAASQKTKPTILQEDFDLEPEEKFFANIHRPTRSGRQPKRSHVFTIDIPEVRHRKVRRTEKRLQTKIASEPKVQNEATNPSGGQLLLITGESTDAVQVIHVYMISPSEIGQPTSLDLTTLLNQVVLKPSSEEQVILECESQGETTIPIVE